MLFMAAAVLRPTMGVFNGSNTTRCLLRALTIGGGGGQGQRGASCSTFRRITTSTTTTTSATTSNNLRLTMMMMCQQKKPQQQMFVRFNQNNNNNIKLSPSCISPFLLFSRSSSTLARNSHYQGNISTRPPFPLQYHYASSSSSWMKMIHSPQSGAVSYFSSSFFSGKPPRGGSGGGNRAMQGIGLLGAASVLLGKTKYVLAALKFTKLASLGSMVFTIGTYSMFFGLPYAVGMVGLIAVHEAGHAAVMHQRGIPFSPAVFIPFMGAVIATKQMPRDAWEDAVIAAGGPVLGSLGAGVVAIGAAATDSQLLYALADFGFMINLFNMMPIGSMDGGRIAGALSPYASLAGIGMGGMLAYQGVVQNPLFYLILLAGGYDTFMRFYDPYSMRPPNYYKITPVQRAVLTTGYFGLIVALLAAMSLNQRHQKPPEVLMREHANEQHWDMR